MSGHIPLTVSMDVTVASFRADPARTEAHRGYAAARRRERAPGGAHAGSQGPEHHAAGTGVLPEELLSRALGSLITCRDAFRRIRKA